MRSSLITALALITVALAGCSEGPADTDGFDQVVPPPADGLGVIRGLVLDPTIAPIADATIALQGGEEATSDSEGRFVFSDVEPGAHFLTVSHPQYETIQASTTVVADVDKPEVLRIQLLPIPVIEPFATASTYTGWVSCEMQIANYLESCDVGVGIFGEADNMIFLPIEGGVPDVVQVEIGWKHTQAFGERMTSTWAGCNDEYCSAFGETSTCQHWGASPLWCRQNATGGSASGHQSYGDGLTAGKVGQGSNPGIGLHLGADCTACAPLFPAVGLGLIIEQKIDTYAWSFFNMQPEEGWVFLSDGPPAGA